MKVMMFSKEVDFFVVVPRVLLDSEQLFDCWENVVF